MTGDARGAPDHAPGLERAFAGGLREGTVRLRVTGELPAALHGVCFWNGPGSFARGRVRYRHWLDGDGVVCRLALDGGAAELVVRHVSTAKRQAEVAAGEALFRTFGTGFPGDHLLRGVTIATPVNLSAHLWGGRLLAFGEQGLPWELDPESLESVGPVTFGGRLTEITPFSGHPRFDLETGDLFNFGIGYASRTPTLHLYRVAAGGRLALRRRMPLDAPRSIHDFALSEGHVVFYMSPYVLDIDELVRGERTVMEALEWQPELGSRILVLDRDGREVADVGVDTAYCLHLINCFDRDGAVVVDVLELDRPVYDQYQPLPELFVDVPLGRPVRFVITPDGGRPERRELAYERAPDFPTVPRHRWLRPYDELWLLGMSAAGRMGRKFYDELVRLSWTGGLAEAYRSPPGRYLAGQPAFLPDPAEPDRGHVVCPEFDAEGGVTRFLVFSSHSLSRGPVATLTAERPLPLLFHSSAYPDRGAGAGGRGDPDVERRDHR